MKRSFLALATLAISSTAWAQAPGQVQQLAGPFLPTPIQQVSGARFLSGPACGAGCGRAVCVPEATTVKHTKNNYSSECGHACYRQPSLFSFLNRTSCDTGCADGGCSKAYTTKYLVKKVCTTEIGRASCRERV